MNRKRIILIAICTFIMAFAMTLSAYGATSYDKYDSVKTGKVTTSSLYVRADASKKAESIGSVSSGDRITLYGEKKDANDVVWYKITYYGKSGFVSSQYVDIVKTYSYVIYTPVKYGKASGSVNVRSDAGLSYDKVGHLSKGKKKIIKGYKIAENGKKWYRISYDGKAAYVSSKYLGLISKTEYNKKVVKSTKAKGQAVATYALRFVGKTPYRSGGSSLKSGCDCSGFVRAVYKHFGYSLPHSSWGIEDRGRGVKRSSAQPGDIICTNGHVGIYIGGGKMVHARQPGERVRIDNIGYGSSTSYNGKHIRTIRRIVK